MHVFTSRWMKRGESWFQWQEPESPVDIVDYFQLAQPLRWAVCRPFYTYTISLARTPEAILARFNQTTRRDVRQAGEKHGITCRTAIVPNAEDVELFIATHADFAAAKKQPALNTVRLRRLLADHAIWFSFAYSPAGDLLVAHGTYIGGGRMRSLYALAPLRWQPDTPNEIRQSIGRAGRYLTWSDMLAARDAGLRTYDFGGWYAGTVDKERLAINAYKQGYGGDVICEYNCQRAFTLRGYMALGPCAALDWLRRLRIERHKSHPVRNAPLPASLPQPQFTK
jgi:hypothetical protein